ncbi:type II toxin-antitoxin system VapC family toxin [Nocardioides massiliensis]|uniref:Ribonuclease VapC n=1 Tax=Nocardioides massiliensis TaxID=1325935 RepID=A0ABT9NMZ0_9ACTN|nr:type II toxin-antitoxin system VapC family toxin [Nocardioides massiliensis]MDP9821612.1 putative nucleic acid-binding protein [Nocardioides massiliensis]
MSVLVVDAALVVDLVCDFPPAAGYRAALASAEAVAAPAHLDAEVLSALGRLHRAGRLTHAAARVEALRTFSAQRWPLQPLLPAAWALTDRIATRDALYVALAASLDAVLLTTDERLRRGAAGLVAVTQPAD